MGSESPYHLKDIFIFICLYSSFCPHQFCAYRAIVTVRSRLLQLQAPITQSASKFSRAIVRFFQPSPLGKVACIARRMRLNLILVIYVNLIHRKRFSLRLGHTRGKMILNHFLTLSCRFATLPQRGRLSTICLDHTIRCDTTFAKRTFHNVPRTLFHVYRNISRA